ncbi:hypothetical protein [Marinoscillum sp. MHG1-6]|uniref:hypothetical protein n=1 Tax=Marinoscillum sp. MHG1-6 TaxID=2959627 RepID=UPI00215765ED|nr:hypothetical protein [Marinoscillum sp. MHG1-6]
MSTLSITFTNYSGIELYRDYWSYVMETGFSGLTTSPSTTLNAMSGQTSISTDQILSELDQGPLELSCCWRTPSGQRFGVKVHANFQMFGIGPRPEWYVMSDNKAPGTAPSWKESGSDPASPYNWSGISIKVVATPTSTHMTLQIQVQIDDLKNA